MTESINPLLARLVLPGETFRLPSQGLFYTHGELSDEVKDGEVHVFPMTAYDEIVFKTPDMLLSGNAIDEVFKRCIPQILEPRKLLSKDVDYLITCLRVITYGSDITLTYQHTCDGAKEHEYVVSLQDILRKAKSIDPTSLATAYTITMKNGQIVKVKPTTFNTILELNQNFNDTNEDYSIESMQHKILKVLVDMIESVDDTTNRDHIEEWARKLPAGWVKFLSTSIDQVSDWGVEFKAPAKCKDCGATMEMPFSANPVSFFS